MKEPMQNYPVQTARQLEKMRKLYSQIGEPLPVDIMIDLHMQLGKALQLNARDAENASVQNRARRRKTNIC